MVSQYLRRRRRVRRRRGIPVLFIGLLVLAFLMFYFFISRTTTHYDEKNRLLSAIITSTPSDTIEGFAKDLVIVSTKDRDVDDFTPVAGLLAQVGGEMKVQKAATERMHPASTTKILTALLALKYGNLSDVITVGKEVEISESGASMAGLLPGDTLTLEQLLYALMLPSGNDAANAIAVHIAGSIDAFADLMNTEAYALGAVDSHFTNPHGLTDEAHYTTAYDLYLILNAAIQNPKFIEITGSATYVANYIASDGSAISKTWSNGNRYIVGSVEEPDGIFVFSGKTGTTSAAGSCLVIASQDEMDETYISVVLKADNRDILYDNMTKLLEKIKH